MKHIQTFESFDLNEENVFRKFTTGHETKGDEQKSEKSIEDKLSEIEKDMESNPDKYAQSGDRWESAKKAILAKAKENRFRGSIRVQKGGRNPKLFVVYDEKLSGLQNVAVGASSRRDKPLG